MTRQNLVKINFLIFLCASIIVGTVFGIYANRKEDVRLAFRLPVTASYQESLPTISSQSKSITTSQISPDGSHNLIMIVTNNYNMTKTYIFTSSETADNEKKQILKINLTAADDMNIPFNTWSPDNKYVFIEHNTASGSSALVMKKDGNTFTDDGQYLDVKKIFSASNKEFVYQKATGWASETLLIVNSIRLDGSKGPSFWFEVPSKQIIQLYTEF